MIPSVNQFPEFVADQLLTAEDLNNMFGYLEEQERLTRTTMIGIGIICGLEVKTATDGTKLTITRGAGDTSEGYLMRMEQETFFEYKDFNAVKPKFYDVFVNTTVEADGEIKRTQKFPIWELFSKSEEEATPLSKEFLSDKIVLLFYELLEKDAKNCDPVSCDDKGRDVLVTIRKLLIKKEDAEKILPKEKTENISEPIGGGAGRGELPLRNLSLLFGAGNISAGVEDALLKKLALPDLKLRRFDVPATNLVNANDIFEAWQRILTRPFVDAVDNALLQLHKVYRNMVTDVVTGNPFANFAARFAFVHDGSISGNRLLHFQYYYDFFFDLIQAYDELRLLGLRMLAQCCPDPGLFPRHLLLGEAIPPADQMRSRYRNYFIPSPILNNQGELWIAFKILYKRLVLMIDKVEMPVPSSSLKNKLDANIRITPSKLGDYTLSQKSLPYYYRVNDSNGRLFLYWSHELSRRGVADQVLSYHASKYNTTDDFVINPLKYDIEPYNFFRIEGHIGKNYRNVLATVTALRNSNRLPFDVVALSASLNEGEIDFSKTKCHFQDLEAVYNTLKAELVCLLCKQMIYYYGFPPFKTDLPNKEDTKSGVPLLKSCSPNFIVKEKTLGSEFELLYPDIKDDDFNIRFFQPLKGSGFGIDPYALRMALLFYMEKVFEQLKNFLGQFDEKQFDFYHSRLVTAAQALRRILKTLLTTATDHARQVELEDEIDHLDALLVACTQKSFEALETEYKRRIRQLAGLRQLSKFVQKHPGIEHKAGVPKGGTFILVYHEQQKNRVISDTPGIYNIMGAVADLSNLRDRDIIENAVSYTGTGTTSSGARRAGTPRDIERITDELASLGVKRDILDSLKENLYVNQPSRVGLFDPKIANYEDGTVIADFYLPYLCCSDCPPIYYVLTEQPEDKPVFEIQPRFLFDDAHNYPFTVAPMPKTVDEIQNPNELTVFIEEGKGLFLQPAMEIDKTLSATLTYKDITLPITIVKPNAAFKMKAVKDAAGASQLHLEAVNKNEPDAEYLWTINGKESGSASDFTTPMPNADKLVIELTITYEINHNFSEDVKKATVIINQIPTTGDPVEPAKYD